MYVVATLLHQDRVERLLRLCLERFSAGVLSCDLAFLDDAVCSSEEELLGAGLEVHWLQVSMLIMFLFLC